MKTLNQKIKGISAARRKKVEARAVALIAAEMTLRELRRRARRATQSELRRPGV